MRGSRAQHTQGLERQTEMRVVGRQAGEGSRRHGDAVIGTLPRDDLVFFRLANSVEIIAQQFDLGIIGVGARVPQKHPGIADRDHGRQGVGQLHGGGVRFPTEHVTVGQLAHLLGGGFDELLIAVTQRRAPQASKTFQVLFAGAVIDVYALPALDNQLLGCGQVGGGINHL